MILVLGTIAMFELRKDKTTDMEVTNYTLYIYYITTSEIIYSVNREVYGLYRYKIAVSRTGI